MNERDSSRSTTPISLMTSSFPDISSTFDDLTAAIADLSRIPSPEPVDALACCCGKESCDNFRSWLTVKGKLGQRLVLSAEVGQALLQRHEAYIRKTERKHLDESTGHPPEDENRLQVTNENLQRECDDLVQEKAHLEKRLNQALVNSEVTEVSSKTILQELHEAKDTISRLTAHHARSVGWETRLAAAVRERDDMQQERDGEVHRARLAESRFAVLKDKTAKLQAEVRRLQENLEEKRLHRLESSEHLIQDARSRLETFRNSVTEDELTSVLEAMVHDNEVLKRDNAELQHLLADSRDQMHHLREELEEQRANPPSRMSRSGGNTPHSRHHHTGSVPTIGLKEFMLLSPPRRSNPGADGKLKLRTGPPSISIRRSTAAEPATPDTGTRSPTDSLAALSESKWASFGQLSPGLSASSAGGHDENAEPEGSPTLCEKPRVHRPLLLLARSRGVQTEKEASPSSYLSPNSPYYPRSETSSYSESQPSSSHMTSILERIAASFNRIAQADAFTLTNRLKRQHLKGADVGHLSRSTVSNILAEVTGLRAQFRFLLEDEKLVTSCSRKDLRSFFNLVRDIFVELGQLRVAMNEVILDPSSAVKLSEHALNPNKASNGDNNNNNNNGLETGGHGGGAAAWMAPLSKLFLPSTIVKADSSGGGGGGGGGGSGERGSITTSSSGARNGPANASRPPMFVPKLGPALAASATTVNVEFSGTGVGRAVTSTVLPTVSTSETPRTTTTSLTMESTTATTSSSSSGLLGIFVGAPKPIEAGDPWVVLPSVQQQQQQQQKKKPSPSSSSVLVANNNVSAGAPTRGLSKRFSRNVDAVVDVVDDDRPGREGGEERTSQHAVSPLMQRTLRRRGLSDSSIHSTFVTTTTSHAADQDSTPSSPRKLNASSSPSSSRMPAAWRDPNSMMFQAFRWGGMFNFGQPADSSAPNITTATHSQEATPGNHAATAAPAMAPPRRTPPANNNNNNNKVPQSKPIASAILPGLASWATSTFPVDLDSGDVFIPSSSGVRDEETYLVGRAASRRSASREETHYREFY